MEASFARKSYNTTLAVQERVQKKYIERMKRTYSILQSVDAQLADEVFNQHSCKQANTRSFFATKIQKVYRGFKARELYRDMLFDIYQREQAKEKREELRRMEEGLLMMENIRLEEEIRKKQFLTKQKDIEKTWAATVIQRRYRLYKSLPTPHFQISRKAFPRPVSPVHKLQPVVLPHNEYHLDISEVIEPPQVTKADIKHSYPHQEGLFARSDTNRGVFDKQHNVSSEEHSPLSTCVIEHTHNEILKFKHNEPITCEFSMTLYNLKKDKEPCNKKELDTQVIRNFAIKESKNGLPFVIRSCADVKEFSKPELIQRISELNEGLQSN